MPYTVQNSSGEVYGTFAFPDGSTLTIQEWEVAWRFDLRDILGDNGVFVSNVEFESMPGERIIVDIKPLWDIQERLEKVHRTVGMLASSSRSG